MDIDVPSYVLRKELLGHGAAVRSLCVTPSGELVSGGADAIVNRWDVKSSGESSGQSPQVHSHNVLALTPLAPGLLGDCPAGGFISGCQDHTVRVFNSEGAMVRELLGHDHGVISLSFVPRQGKAPLLVTGSWDGTAKLWDLSSAESLSAGPQCVGTLSGHENGVCVLGLPNGDVATGSTGRQEGESRIVGARVRVWRFVEDGSGWKEVASEADHLGPVRSLCLAPGLGFISTSNDGTARVRDLNGETMEVVPHPHSGGAENFVYCGVSLATAAAQSSSGGGSDLGGGGGSDIGGSGGGEYFVTCSEDSTASVWRLCGEDGLNGVSHELLEHPDSVWCACALPGGDVATGCNDGVVRLWTRSSERAATSDVVARYAEQVEGARAKKRGGPSSEEVAKLPSWEKRLATPGRGEGDVKVFNKGGTAVAAQWSASSSPDWVVVGEVTGQASENAGAIDGVRFDHVLPIEFEQPGVGLTKLQIGYNTGENPYTIAHGFIAKHGLDQGYLEQVADYIRKNTGAGAHAPIIGQEAGPHSSSAAGSASSSSSSSFGGSATAVKAKKYATFDGSLKAVGKIEAKLLEFNADLACSSVEAAKALDAMALVAVRGACEVLSATSRWHVSAVDPKILPKAARALCHAMHTWPADKVFPAVDLLRLIALHPDGATTLAAALTADERADESPEDESLARCLGLLVPESPGRSPGCPPAPMALQLTTLRLACNLFAHEAPRLFVAGTSMRVGALVAAAAPLVQSETKNVRAAAASLLFNFASALTDPQMPPGSVSPATSDFFAAVAAACAAACGPNAAAVSDERALACCLQAAQFALSQATGPQAAAKAAALASPLPGCLATLAATPAPPQVTELAKSVANLLG